MIPTTQSVLTERQAPVAITLDHIDPGNIKNDVRTMDGQRLMERRRECRKIALIGGSVGQPHVMRGGRFDGWIIALTMHRQGVDR